MPMYGLLSCTDDFSRSYILLSIDEKNLHDQFANKDYFCLTSLSNFVEDIIFFLATSTNRACFFLVCCYSTQICYIFKNYIFKIIGIIIQE